MFTKSKYLMFIFVNCIDFIENNNGLEKLKKIFTIPTKLMHYYVNIFYFNY